MATRALQIGDRVIVTALYSSRCKQKGTVVALPPKNEGTTLHRVQFDDSEERFFRWELRRVPKEHSDDGDV